MDRRGRGTRRHLPLQLAKALNNALVGLSHLAATTAASYILSSLFHPVALQSAFSLPEGAVRSKPSANAASTVSALIEKDPMHPRPGEYMLYVDESGDQGMGNIDPAFPVLSIVGCAFLTPAYTALENDLAEFRAYRLHRPDACLHSSDIRRWKKTYLFLRDEQTRTALLNHLTEIIVRADFIILSVTVEKKLLKDGSRTPARPYELAIHHLLATYVHFLTSRRARGSILFESRGKREDNDVRGFYQAKMAVGTLHATPGEMRDHLPHPPRFATKQPPCAGLEVADLAAYPIARYAINASAENRPFEALRSKIYDGGEGLLHKWGLLMLP